MYIYIYSLPSPLSPPPGGPRIPPMSLPWSELMRCAKPTTASPTAAWAPWVHLVAQTSPKKQLHDVSNYRIV